MIKNVQIFFVDWNFDKQIHLLWLLNQVHLSHQYVCKIIHQLSLVCCMVLLSHVFKCLSVLKDLSLRALVAGITRIILQSFITSE